MNTNSSILNNIEINPRREGREHMKAITFCLGTIVIDPIGQTPIIVKRERDNTPGVDVEDGEIRKMRRKIKLG